MNIEVLQANHISQALQWIGQLPWLDDSPRSESRYLESFVSRNGPLTMDTVLRLVTSQHTVTSAAQRPADTMFEPVSDEDFDRIFALAVLGATQTEEARDVLIPYLTSRNVQVRWISAMALARMHEAQAFPAVSYMLKEFISPNEPRNRYGQEILFYEEFRQALPRIVWEWGLPGAASALRSALLAALWAEAHILKPDSSRPIAIDTDADILEETAEAWFQYDNRRLPLIKYQDDLVYGLGRLHAFGALAAVDVSSDIYYLGVRYDEKFIVSTAYAAEHAARFRLNIWCVHAACASLEGIHIFPKPIFRFDRVPEFKRAVEQLLEESFGLTSEDRIEAFQDYEAVGQLHRLTRYVARK